MSIYVTYIITYTFQGASTHYRDRTLRWDGPWKWTAKNVAKVKRALSNENTKSAKFILQDVKELEDV